MFALSYQLSRFFYTSLLFCVSVLYLPWRLLRQPRWRFRFGERMGRVTLQAQGGVWFHLASVGETMAARPLIDVVRREYPQLPLLLSSTTLTGANAVRTGFGDDVEHVFVPWDLPGSVRRFLDATRPKLLALMETELWPNLIEACHRRGIPVLLLNARLSAASARGYRWSGALGAGMMSRLTMVGAQSEADAQRFARLGVAPSRLRIMGNLKFDNGLSEAEEAEAARLRTALGSRTLWVVGSTHRGEEALILQAAERLWKRFPDMLLALAPRHPERFEEVASLCESSAPTQHYAQYDRLNDRTRILLVDVMGRLTSLYSTASVALIGGSLIPAGGGHNMLEAAQWSVPTLSGPHVFNFSGIASRLEEAGGLRFVDSVAAMVDAMTHWLENDDDRRRAGCAAESVVREGAGAARKALAMLAENL